MEHFELGSKDNGAIFAYGCILEKIEKVKDGYKLIVKDVDGSMYSFFSKVVVNSAGLSSDKVANMVGILNYKIHYCKGEYFTVSNKKSNLVKRLIYPHPTNNSLGIHTVVDLAGQLKLGPSAFYVDDIDYDVDISHKREFVYSVSSYLEIKPDDLSPDMSGIRAKLQGPDDPFADFVIKHEKDSGFYGFINLVGIDSPGFTASPAIAEYVNSIINEYLV